MSLENYQKLFNDNRIPVARTDLAGTYVDVNDAYKKLVGYSLTELQQLTYPDLTPEQWHSLELGLVFKTVFAQGEASYEKEYIRKSGEIIKVKAHVFIIKDSDGESGMWGTFEQI